MREKLENKDRKLIKAEAEVSTCSFGANSVPDVAVVIVVAGHQEAAGIAEGDGGDAANDVVVVIDGQLLVGADVEQATGGVVGPRGQGITVGKELKRAQK